MDQSNTPAETSATDRCSPGASPPVAAVTLKSPPIPHPLPTTDASSLPFGASLEPVLIQACEERLSKITWFRTPWQRGGAATGYATYRAQDDQVHPAVVKLPVPPGERDWLLRLQTPCDLAPRLYAHGENLAGYDLAWVVMERLPHGPLGTTWNGKEFDLLVEAIGRFYAASAAVPLPAPPPERDWQALMEQARKNTLKLHEVQHEQRWKNAFKKVHKKLDDWLVIWNQRPRQDWCHGDLHLANAMTRQPAPQGPALLLDFAQTHPGHWVEDAVYFEHLFWARRQRLGGRKLCSQIAHERKKLGLHVDADWPRLASIKRALLAMSTPAMLQHDGDRHHVEAALAVLEIEVAH